MKVVIRTTRTAISPQNSRAAAGKSGRPDILSGNGFGRVNCLQQVAPKNLRVLNFDTIRM